MQLETGTADTYTRGLTLSFQRVINAGLRWAAGNEVCFSAGFDVSADANSDAAKLQPFWSCGGSAIGNPETILIQFDGQTFGTNRGS